MPTIEDIKRHQLYQYVGFRVDDALHGEPVPEGLTAETDRTHGWLIGWQCGFEPMFVLVYSYLPNVRLDASEAIELAIDYLLEINWFSDQSPARSADFVFEPIR